MQGHNNSILETGYRFGHPKSVPKNFIILKNEQVCYCAQIYLCELGAFQQTKLISLMQNPINCDPKHFADAY